MTTLLAVQWSLVRARTSASTAGPPDGVEPHTHTLALREVRDEGEVRDLCGRPPKLEDNDKTREVEYLVRDVHALAGDAIVVDEEHTSCHTHCPNEVPGLPSAVVPTPHAVTLVATEGSAERVCNLPNQYQRSGHAIGQLDDEMVEHQHVGEPHAGTEVVQNVPHAKGKPYWIRQLLFFLLVCIRGRSPVCLYSCHP